MDIYSRSPVGMVTGKPYATALRELVLDPLGLTSTTADPAGAGVTPAAG